jgi:hypothetical protein
VDQTSIFATSSSTRPIGVSFLLLHVFQSSRGAHLRISHKLLCSIDQCEYFHRHPNFVVCYQNVGTLIKPYHHIDSTTKDDQKAHKSCNSFFSKAHRWNLLLLLFREHFLELICTLLSNMYWFFQQHEVKCLVTRLCVGIWSSWAITRIVPQQKIKCTLILQLVLQQGSQVKPTLTAF